MERDCKQAGTPYVQVELLTAEEYERIKAFPGVMLKHESNIGDEAYFFRAAITGFSLIFKMGTAYFSVYTMPFNRSPQDGADDEKCKSIERAIARQITGQS